MAEQPILSRDGEPLVVAINDVPCPDIHVLVIQRGIGGRMVDHAILEVGLNSHRDLDVGPLAGIIKKGVLAQFNAFDMLSAGTRTPLFVTITRKSDDRVLFWGVISGAQLAIGSQPETLRLICRLEDYLIGPKKLCGIETPRMGQFSEDAVQIIDEPIVFNPIQDGRVRPNMGFDSLSGSPYKAFVDPDSVATVAGQKNNNLGEPGAFWTVADALLYLCWRANPNEKYVLNPTRVELVNQLTLPPTGAQHIGESLAEQSEIVRNIGIRDGSSLSEALDQFCSPLSLFWWVEVLSATERKLVFILPSGDYDLVTSDRIPAPGSAWNVDAGLVREVELECSIAETINAVEVVCDYLYVEAAFPLIKTWDDDDVPGDVEDLYEDSDAWKATPSIRRVYRLFTADYLTLERDELTTDVLPELRELVLEFFNFSDHYVGDEKVSNNIPSPLLDWKIARRGRFYPTITLGPDGEPIGTDPGGVVLEYSEEDDAQGNPIWLPLRELLVGSGCELQLLDNQFGIYLAGSNPPWRIIDLYEQGKGPAKRPPEFRIVATIRSDLRGRVLNRIEPYDGIEPAGPDEPEETKQPLPNHHVEDASRRFQYRAVHRESPFFDKLDAGELDADVINDIFPTEFEESPAQRYAKQLRAFFDAGKLRCRAVLDGLDAFTGRLGSACSNLLEARGITMQGAATAGYPRIIAINYDVPRQVVSLTIESQPAVPYQSPYPSPDPSPDPDQ